MATMKQHMNDKIKTIEIYTDGACIGNPGPGGWAALLIFLGTEKMISGGTHDTTNNRMEMQAAIEGLKQLKESCYVRLYSDSQLLVKGMTEWMEGWLARGFKTAAKKPVANTDLWKVLLELADVHDIEWHWVKGHAGHQLNEAVDQEARRQAEHYATAG